METPSRWVFIRNTPLGCEVLRTEWKMDQENRPPIEDVGDDVSTDSETNFSNDSDTSFISSSSSDHSVPDEVEGRNALEEIVNVVADANPQEERDRDGWRTAEFIEIFNSRTQNTSYMAISVEMTPEYFQNLQYGAELTIEEKEQIANLLYKYRECFATSLTDVRRTKLLEHQIWVPEGTRPVYRLGLKRFSQHEMAFTKEQMEAQLNAWIIRENNRFWCAPATLAWKKSCTYRFCVAYFGLNKATERESWPLPNIEEVLDNLAGHCYYTTLDGFLGFNTIPIRAKDQQYTMFLTPFGTYCYTVMLFGLKNAPHTYCCYVMMVF